MAEGKSSRDWNYWSSSFALTANCNRDPKKSKPFNYEDFHPYLAAKAAANKKQGIGDFLTAMKTMARKRRFRR